MADYTIFAFKKSGVAPTFISLDAADDAAAAVVAMKLLEDHLSADRVTVWRGEGVVFSGLSAACSAWLAAAGERVEGCPALALADQPCPPDCARFGAVKADPQTPIVAALAITEPPS